MSKQSATCHPERSVRAKGLCNPCYAHTRYKAHRQRYLGYALTWRFKHLYGITPEDYEALFKTQHGLCAICKNPPKRKKLFVDHCHGSGRVRGLLCDTCNLFLGGAHDNIEVLQAAITYLKGGLI